MSEVEHSGGGCFDRVKFTLSVKGGRISELKFRARACSGTIAACSALSEEVNEMGIDEAKQYSVQNLFDYLDGVPEKKMHSVELAIAALHKALEKLDSP